MQTSSKYRLYIDEVGNADLKSSTNPNERYLSLTGICFGYQYVEEVVHPRLEKLKKKYFRYHHDDPIILHRKEILKRKGAFDVLKAKEVSCSFDQDLLQFLAEAQYTVFTVLIDKYEHLMQYKTWHYNPYHYCQEVLLERFILWLETKGKTGDILAESRGGKEDKRLKDSFNRLYRSGTEFVSAEKFQNYLTSCQLKVKNKSNNIAGLQIADIIAYPSYRYMLKLKEARSLDGFAERVVNILRKEKYYRSPTGELWGWGLKWLP